MTPGSLPPRQKRRAGLLHSGRSNIGEAPDPCPLAPAATGSDNIHKPRQGARQVQGGPRGGRNHPGIDLGKGLLTARQGQEGDCGPREHGNEAVMTGVGHG